MIKNLENIHHVAIYLRISQEKKGENVETLENHRQILIEFCEEHGFTYEEFGEVISGGKSEITQRVALKRLLDNIEKYDAIACFELTRISRNGLISQTVKQYCIDYDKPILTPYQSYDLANSETDRLLFDVGSMISSHEHSTIGKRSKANKMQMSKAGLHVSGNVPFGYKRNNDTKKLEIDEEAAPTIRYIFQLHSEGFGSFKIRDILNNEGYKSATGKAFNLPSIKRIIRNPAYKGTLVFNNRKKIKRNGKFEYDNVETITVENAHPAIIPPDVWAKANQDRESRARKSISIREKPATKSGVTLLKDLIFCGVCGRKMIIRKDTKDSIGYTLKKCEYLLPNGEKCPNCGKKLDAVIAKVLDGLRMYTKNLTQIEDQLKSKSMKDLNKKNELKLEQIEKAIKENELKQKNLIDLAMEGLFTHEEIRDKKQELVTLLDELRSKKEEIIKSISSMSVEEELETIKERKEILEELKDITDQEYGNQLLKQFIKKIHFTRVIPEDILKKSTRNKERKEYPFEIEFEFFD
ncbi:recombinase family protein [Bacillus stercoris]|uniref:recombinase family protein n=1 Tax=Bacillus stercoris TaxID=2054641 RepID=UPI00244387B9|nr:recombinase family protein [Bacillus stercoris]WGE40981.1 recombinase family protein [Bacillus stercoris]